MITHRAVAMKFKAGESMERMARTMTLGRDPLRRNYRFNLHWIEHAIRAVLKRQKP